MGEPKDVEKPPEAVDGANSTLADVAKALEEVPSMEQATLELAAEIMKRRAAARG